MKCTTKILIGILLSGIVVVLIGSVLLYSNDGPKENLTFEGKPVQVNVSPFRVVNVLVDSGERLSEDHVLLEGNLSIQPAIAVNRHVLSYPEDLEHYLSVVTKNDTLTLIFNISESTLPGKFKNKEWIFMKFSTIKLTADSSLVAVSSEARRLNLQLLNIKADTVALRAYSCQVDSCDFRSFSIKDTGKLELKNSRICNAYLDLDGVYNWSVAHCQLDNGFLTGSGEHYNVLQKGECRQMYWIPKNKDAQLRVTLKEEAKVSLLK